MGVEGWAELFGSASVGLDHLELRDSYALDTEDERYLWWREHRAELPREEHPWWDLTAATAARGVLIRRARIVSVPVTEYIAFEHAASWQNVAAGEHLRWLPRSRASDLLVPGNDFWLIDGERVLFNLFDGEGRPTGKQFTDDAEVVKAVGASFTAVWERATDHAEFRLG
ncbi:hypothetical protein DPM19_25030 [Actinomadura craniellae]|uniref:DUF6879 domain-containing protein n=1 Tax=Actinomadura craniellae TaxID=2231787 RepID=A0A365H0I1_9ACTN|nr:hypothetical protein DPM19_25030 [Actinomadura craniellae]